MFPGMTMNCEGGKKGHEYIEVLEEPGWFGGWNAGISTLVLVSSLGQSETKKLGKLFHWMEFIRIH